MKVTLSTPASGTAASPKLVKAAREFEAILLQNWLEKMNKSMASDSDSQDAAHDTITSMGAQAVATALSARGGIGLAGMLLQHLESGGRRTEQKTG
jgi:Rod binding domain-containing protein